MRIAKVGVVGAGAMGSGIAALAASAGVPVVLLDVPGPDGGPRNAPALTGLEKARKAKPAAFMDGARAALVTTGNTVDDLALLADCDWIVEAIVELPAPKQELYARLEGIIKPTAIVSSNTSGIPMAVLTAGRSDRFRRRFLGTHFFNPPRYMHLLEVIPTAETDPAVVAAMRHFAERVLGKGIVRCKDAPGFIANRLGVYGMVATMRRMMQHGLTIDEVDGLTGVLVGRAKTATFRTGDLSGLDVLMHVTQGLAQVTGEDFAMPDWVAALVAQGKLGDKTGGGFYQKTKDGVLTYDWKTATYGPQQRLEGGEIGQLSRLPHAQRLAQAAQLPGAHGAFLRDHLVDAAHYALTMAPQLAYDLESVDRAMVWGYGWEIGPFQVMDALGAPWLRAQFSERGLAEPPLLSQVDGTFYRGTERLSFVGGYDAVAPIPDQLSLAAIAGPGRTVDDAGVARLIDLGDGVLCFEFRSKMNSLGEGVLRALRAALERVTAGGYEGLVIGNDDSRTFSAGADLSMVAFAAAARDWDGLAEATKFFQDTSMLIRRAPFPVVAAPFGLTLGGGCEFALHADRVQAHAELYMGLVEAGVGLLPGGGGTKELLFRFTRELAAYEEADLFEGVKRAFQLIALGKTSTSALEAQSWGLLRASDRISMNRDTLLSDAKRRVLDLAPDYVAPPPMTVRALGREALGNLEYALWSFKEAGQASAHDVRVGHAIAYVLCGGDGTPRDVTEQDVLDLEREQFLSLLGTKETRERIEYTLKTGKPLRN
ncbi:MAG: 3-hydroxyacyl-CoA dehydrogenase/enoyl-CoA hydratase family protein [Gemmatimonadaceae bacterium]|nr:3-hydroxyacyl-CoA dehydrogenase/enoyl-CoA hydratase family protein [Gemmatimonadaceae bacterium]